MRNAEMLTQKP